MHHVSCTWTGRCCLMWLKQELNVFLAFWAREQQTLDGFPAISAFFLRRFALFGKLDCQTCSWRISTQSTEIGQGWPTNNIHGTIRAKRSLPLVRIIENSLVLDTKNMLSEYCYQYRCGWDNGVGYIHCVRRQRRTTYFCINYPTTAVKRLRLAMKFEPNIVYRDFFVDTLVANESSGQWQANINQRRQLLQNYVGARVFVRFRKHLRGWSLT